jgi:hypothetical protein
MSAWGGIAVTIDLPDVDGLTKMDDRGFARVVCDALARHGLNTPGFNLAADAAIVAPSPARMIFYPGEARGLVFSAVKALREFDRTGQISLSTREEFILADVEDRLRLSDAGHEASGQAMEQVASRMTGISSLALISLRVKA